MPLTVVGWLVSFPVVGFTFQRFGVQKRAFKEYTTASSFPVILNAERKLLPPRGCTRQSEILSHGHPPYVLVAFLKLVWPYG